MEQIYLRAAPNLQNSFTYATRSQVWEGTDPEEQMLLTSSSHKLVAEILNVPELDAEVARAVHQVETGLARRKALEKERLEMGVRRKEEQQRRQ